LDSAAGAVLSRLIRRTMIYIVKKEKHQNRWFARVGA
jgi:hypothetical protein